MKGPMGFLRERHTKKYNYIQDDDDIVENRYRLDF